MTLQAFKENDTLETQVRDCFLPVLVELGGFHDDFYEGAYTAYGLGEVLLELERSPFAGVVSDDLFISSFNALHEFFTRPGTFEFYLDVIRAVWGEGVDVEFSVPSPGVLLINIDAVDFEETNFLAREIVENQYTYPEVLDDNLENILFQTAVGIKTQAEADALIRELAPAGLWVVATLI